MKNNYIGVILKRELGGAIFVEKNRDPLKTHVDKK